MRLPEGGVLRGRSYGGGALGQQSGQLFSLSVPSSTGRRESISGPQEGEGGVSVAGNVYKREMAVAQRGGIKRMKSGYEDKKEYD